jgi:hypothetical protein
MRMIRPSRLAVVTALALPLGLLLAAPASAGTGPYYNTDAYGTGCAGGGASWYVAATTPITNNAGVRGGYVQLWYSSTCGTNWSRVVAQPPSGVTVDAGSLGTFTDRQAGKDGVEESTSTIFPFGDGSNYSGQVYSPNNVSCAHGYYNSNGGFFQGEVCV